MRCPKCQYISYESADRCKNCGYDFPLAVDADELDLALKTGDEPVGPLVDLDLASEPDAPPPPLSIAPRHASTRAPDSSEFPLFRGVDEGTRTLPPVPPRTAVGPRKAAPVRPAKRVDEPALDLEPEVPEPPPRPARGTPAPVHEAAVTARLEGDVAQPAPAIARLAAAVVDLLLLGVIDGVILHFTLAVTGLTYQEVRLVPIVPFAAFLAILNGGYLVTFTVAGGQTIGKMLSGIKVINADPSAHTDRVPFAQAVIRSLSIVVSLAPAGLGFVIGLVTADKRALHDRMAGTRVMRA